MKLCVKEDKQKQKTVHIVLTVKSGEAKVLNIVDFCFDFPVVAFCSKGLLNVENLGSQTSIRF